MTNVEFRMTNEIISTKPEDIHKRIFKWVIFCLKFLHKLPRNSVNNVIIYQLAKSCSSTGANDQEADNASSRRDFISKYKLVKKELAESIFWLKVLRELESTIFDESLLNEANELLKIVASIILSAQKHT